VGFVFSSLPRVLTITRKLARGRQHIQFFSFKIRKCLNLQLTWVGFLVVQKQSEALGWRGKPMHLKSPFEL
jgi:hypothetical protein